MSAPEAVIAYWQSRAEKAERELDRALFDLNQEIDLHEKAEREVAVVSDLYAKASHANMVLQEHHSEELAGLRRQLAFLESVVPSNIWIESKRREPKND